MKKLISLTTACIAIGLMAVSLASCKKDEDSKNCKNSKYPYYCSYAKTCCGYQYFDGKSTCYSSMSSCAATGNACEVCRLEDD